MTVTLPKLVQARTPNQSGRHGHAVTHLVWHSTAGKYAPSIAWLRNPESGASAHLVLREDGEECTQLVALAMKAWHAFPFWNLVGVGVEHASLSRGFASPAQLERSARIFGWLCKHFDIPPVHGVGRPRGIVRHRDLGAAGGNHSDGPSDGVWFGSFLPDVQHNVAVGGYRKDWAR